MLGKRVAVSAVLIPLLVALFWLDARCGASAPVLFVLCVLLGIRSAWELAELLHVRGMAPSFRSCAICVTGLIVATWLPHWYPATPESDFCPFQESLSGVLIVAAGSVLLLMIVRAIRFENGWDGEAPQMESLAAELLVIGYAGILLCVTAQHRWLDAGGSGAYLALSSVVVAAKSGDIGAYSLGRWLGKTKLAPRLSPGKTRVGAVGAVLGACLGTWLWLHLTPPLFHESWTACSTLWSLVFGAVIGIVGLVGDLCESLIKRDVGKKDAAALLPEFGGILDLLDSVLFAGPVAYLLWLYLPLAPWSA